MNRIMKNKTSLIHIKQLAKVDYAYATRVPKDIDLLFLAGSCPIDKNGNVPYKNDYVSQAKLCIVNMKRVLQECNATLDHVVYTRVLVASQNQSDLVTTWETIRKEFGDHDVPSTLLGVTVLGYTDQLVEIEAVAALNKQDPDNLD
jgi:enamine deaminase RidA (YjgF/YER057c/UK114 family)